MRETTCAGVRPVRTGVRRETGFTLIELLPFNPIAIMRFDVGNERLDALRVGATIGTLFENGN